MINRLTDAEFKEKIAKRYGDKYTVLGEYIKSTEKILVKGKCGHEWTPTANSLMAGVGCPECAREKNRNTPNFTVKTLQEREEDFKKKVFEQVGDEYTVIGEYVDTDTHILMRHNKCGNEWLIRPGFFVGKRHTRCPNCNRGPVSEEMANKRLQGKFSNRFVIKKYSGTSKPTLLLDNKCGHEYEYSLQTLLNASDPKNVSPCPICKSIHAEKVKKEKNDARKKRIQATKEKIEHSFKDLYFQWVSNDSLEGRVSDITKTLYSKNITAKFVKENFIKQKHHIRACDTESLKKIVKDEYEVLEEFKGSTTPIKFRHKSCGTEFFYKTSALINRMKSGKSSCPNCMGIKGERKTNEQFQKELDEKFGVNVFLLQSDYLEGRKPVTVKHKCGNVYSINPESLLDKKKKLSVSGCPACGEQSNGEMLITNFLKEHNVNFKSQYVDQRCRSEIALRFDFAILDQNNNIKHLIEFDGQQHFRPVKLWGGKKALKETQKRDKIKDEFCKEHNISLIRIKYDQVDQINSILSQAI